jgi:hypothetical protein
VRLWRCHPALDFCHEHEVFAGYAGNGLASKFINTDIR